MIHSIHLSFSLKRAALVMLLIVFSANFAYSNEEEIEKAKNLIEQQNKYGEAILILKKVVKKDPGNANVWYWLSIANQNIYYKIRETISAMEKAFSLNLDPSKHLNGYDVLGWGKYSSSEPEQSLFYFNKALEIKSDHFSSVKGRGFAYVLLNKPDKALLDLNRVAKQTPNQYDILLKRGWAHYLLGNYIQAVTDFTTIVSKDKNAFHRYEALAGRGWTLFFLSRFDEAIVDFDTLFPQIPPFDYHELKIGALRGKAFALLGLKKFDQVIPLLERANLPSDPKIVSMPEIWSIFRKKESAKRFWEEQGRAKAYIAAAHFIMGNKNKAIQFWGGPGRFGAYLKNYNKNGVTGVQILKEISPVGPALAAGLKSEDIIVSLDTIPVEDTSSFLSSIINMLPGKTVSLDIIRDNKKTKKTLIIGSAEEAIKNSILVKQLVDSSEKELFNNRNEQSQIKKTSAIGPDQLPDMNSEPIMEIENCEVSPSNVKGGDLFKTVIDIFTEDPMSESETLSASFKFSIAMSGKVLKKFQDETIELKNGEVVSLIKSIRAAKKKGVYQIYIEIIYKGVTAKQKCVFEII